MQNLVVVGAAAVIGSLLVLAMILKRMIYICPPNAVLIFSGGHRRLGTEDRTIGYRVVQGGRGVRIPLIEVVDRMDLTNMLIELRVQGSYSKGGIPLNVQGIANVKVSCSAKPRARKRFWPRSTRNSLFLKPTRAFTYTVSGATTRFSTCWNSSQQHCKVRVAYDM